LLKPDSKKVIKILKDFEFYSLIKRLSDFQKSKQNDKIKEVEANRQKALF
jgi:hypothetical protein